MVNLTPTQRKDYGVKVRQARKKMNITAGALATKVGQPVELIQRIELAGPVLWPMSTYERLNNFLGIQFDFTRPALRKEPPGEYPGEYVTSCDGSSQPYPSTVSQLDQVF